MNYYVVIEQFYVSVVVLYIEKEDTRYLMIF